MSADFDTRAYALSHGKQPRGFGMWAFIPADSIWPDGEMPHDAICWAHGTYSDAKREATKTYPKVQRWSVLP